MPSSVIRESYFTRFFHVAIIFGALYGCRQTVRFWPLIPYSILIGHSLSCLAFFSHDLSHNSILKRSWLRTFLETLFWGLNFIPATLWDEVHNHTHHWNANTLRDPDRRYTVQQRDLPRTLYTILLYPSEDTPRWNPLVFIQFLGWIFRNIITALSGSRLGMLPAAPNYTLRQRLRIALEFALIISLQSGIFAFVGLDLVKYLFGGLIPLLIASVIVMSYVFTNHFLNPLEDETEPVASSTSVIVPRIFDWLHCNFSYHTEHHLFPAMNSRHYPLVSKALQENFPNQYNRIPIGEAWRRLWQSQPFAELPSRSATTANTPTAKAENKT